jgi:hypothetical protein
MRAGPASGGGVGEGLLACCMSCGSARMRAAMEAPWRGGLLYIWRAVIFSWLSTFFAAAASCTMTAGRQRGGGGKGVGRPQMAHLRQNSKGRLVMRWKLRSCTQQTG